MNRYTATFHTHLAAMLTERSLRNAGLEARMAPVPRALSSSCGTCVFYAAEDGSAALLDEDWEAVYLQTESGYVTLMQNN